MSKYIIIYLFHGGRKFFCDFLYFKFISSMLLLKYYFEYAVYKETINRLLLFLLFVYNDFRFVSFNVVEFFCFVLLIRLGFKFTHALFLLMFKSAFRS